MLSQVIQTPSQQRWLTKLLGYDYEILYTPGKQNVVADALSRVDSTAVFQAFSQCQPLLLQQLQNFYATHPIGVTLMSKFQNLSSPSTVFTIKQGILYYHDRIFIPLETGFRATLLQEFHDSPLSGHSGIRGTIARLAAAFAWPNLTKDVKLYIKACLICQQSKYSTQKTPGLLQPLPIPSEVWADISMDFITHLPPSKGKTVIWVVIDRLTKFAHFIGLPTGFSAATIAPIFMTEIHRLHGFPTTIVSDRDRVFISKFWTELFRLSGTTLAFSSAYHPQTDGQTEVTNRTLETYLRCFVTDSPQSWFQYLHLAEYWYNTSFHSSLKLTPFEALYGRSPPNLRTYISGSTSVAALDDTLAQRQRHLSLIRDNLTYAQTRMRSQANTQHLDRSFQVGDWVMLRLQPYRQLSVRGRTSPKLSKRFFGPYKILRVIGPVAYELELPPEARIHPVFHVSKLKPFHGVPPTTTPALVSDLVGTQIALAPSAILGTRVLQTPQGPRQQLLIQWGDMDASDATWEDLEVIKRDFPSFDLEDKVHLEPGGDDTVSGPGPSHRSKPARERRPPHWLKDFAR
jgi:transposase InsO family protein